MMGMGYKKKILISLATLVAVFLTFFFLCYFNEDLCSQNTHETLALYMLAFSFSAAFSLSILYFLHEEVFRSWFRFAKWYISLATIAVILSNGSHGGWGIGNIFAPEFVIMWSAGLFFVISLVFIMIKSWKLRKASGA